ncbi:MAG: hypothetical protein VX910_00720 [Candidatus Latescibacterota bacterium]|nr:hypothetical protein [Candidatus Latescibacterota bacterium]
MVSHGDEFQFTEEVYTVKGWDPSKTNVMMRLDNDTVDLSKGNCEDQDYAMGWYHDYGKGRVIYIALSNPDVF